MYDDLTLFDIQITSLFDVHASNNIPTYIEIRLAYFLLMSES